MRLITIMLLLSGFNCFAQVSKTDSLLPVDGMQEDYRYLRGKLETTHPGLYKRRSKEAMQQLMDSLQSTINTPLPFRDFYKKIAFLISETRCEHSYANPGQLSSLIKQWKFLPFQLFFPSGKPFVVINGTSDTSIEPGDEIVSINDRDIDSVRRAIHSYIPADGFISSSRDNFLSSMNFNIAYNQFIEEPGSYALTVRKTDGTIITRKFDTGLDFASINRNAVANPVNKIVLEASKRGDKLRKEQFQLRFEEKAPVAVMTVRSFAVEKKMFRKKIDGFFADIKKRQPTDLIIDLSHNGGGEEELAAYLMSYLIDQPTRFVNEEYLIDISDSTLAMANIPDEVRRNKYAYVDSMREGKSLAKISELAMELKTMEPQTNGYKGRVWIYANGGTSSAASTFCAVAQSNKRATIVGDETAGSFSGGGAVIGIDLTLPNSKIKTHTSILYVDFATKGKDPVRGVIPDVVFQPTFKELIGQNREWIELILSLRERPAGEQTNR
ncbi:S41 family peptidase [Terrimonas sp. NA20]|uniref:S41 family peptidase n=1 Tax=Terrimonas ginsenosidimutans TaxID=2908004 RepID=A0ABS9KMC6_9BACT|nr:S41 family peptidase [Terrimonas ginsenosidimutans]MCG2613451.1 S41 family peptidase [Terrimonas ginsenosidimutans]